MALLENGQRGAGNVDGRQRKIIHIDMDAFYASVEQRDTRAARQAGDRRRPRERGVVAAAATRPGSSACAPRCPRIARAELPRAVFVSPLRRRPGRLEADPGIFERYTPLIEPLSLDEAYLDVTEKRTGMASATEIAQEVRARILEETNLTASAGVSYNSTRSMVGCCLSLRHPYTMRHERSAPDP